MTTNEKGVSKERLFAYVKETTALAKECGIVERAKAAKTGHSTASTYQRLAGPGWIYPAKTAGG